MPTPNAVLEQLTEIIVQVVGCEPDEVVPSAHLRRDLGVDSLTVVEIAEALGFDFGVYIPDEAVNGMRTVGDAINAVVHHDSAVRAPTVAGAAVAMTGRPRNEPKWSEDEIERRKRIAWKFAGWFAVAGIALGAVLGLGGTALLNATGIDDVSAPAQPTPTETVTTTPPTTPPTTASPSEEQEPEPTLEAASNSVSPGERIRLSGNFPGLDDGAELQVQVKDTGGPWDDFPVTTRTSGDGDFTTVIYTTRTGERQFRLLHVESDKPTPVVTINIG